MRLFRRLLILSAMALGFLALFQNCSRVSFSDVSPKIFDKVSEDLRAGGGEVYDGKIIVLHHYEEGFQCEGRPQPESILIRTTVTDWVIIQNSRTKCAEVDRAPASGVAFDPTLMQAQYQNKTYVPPRPYLVDALENPHLPDIKVEDGVCEDINGKCSLLASLQTVGFVSATAATIVHIPAGNYKLNSTLPLALTNGGHEVTLSGADAQTTALDGQGGTSILELGGLLPEGVKINRLTFKNGNSNSGSGSGLSMKNYTGSLQIEDCIFTGNNGDSSIYALGGRDISIRRTQILGNTANFENVEIFGVRGFQFEDSTISGNTATALRLFAVSKARVQNSTIDGNQGSGIDTVDCTDCTFENITVYNNLYGGINILSQFPGDEYDLVIKNSTIFSNKDFSLAVAMQGANNKIILTNSVVASENPALANCPTITSSFGRSILATNSIFDDTSCSVSGSGNRNVAPQLGPLAANGGPTRTLLPLLGSPLIDAGDNATCSPQDQRGSPRPVDNLGGGPRCDIGAVEL